MRNIIFYLLVLLTGIFCFSVYISFQGIIMEIGKKEAARLRDELHNLDLRYNLDREIYYKKLYHIIASGEGFRSRVYRDSKNLLTIGYGFNMDRGSESRKEWNNIFRGSINFDDAKNGEIGITKDQGKMLKQYGVDARERELARIYYPYWEKMRLNERAILTDLYYQSPKLAGKGTRFSNYLKEYYKTSNVIYLKLAHEEVKLRSSYSKNPLERFGLQHRNDIRAIILDSTESKLFSKPNDQLIPENKKLKVILGKTIIPRKISKNFPKHSNLNDYYMDQCEELSNLPPHEVPRIIMCNLLNVLALLTKYRQRNRNKLY